MATLSIRRIDFLFIKIIRIKVAYPLARKRSWFKKAMRELGIRKSQIIALRHLSDDPLTLEKLLRNASVFALSSIIYILKFNLLISLYHSLLAM